MWTCIVCSTEQPEQPLPEWPRERLICVGCGCTWRTRATVSALMLGLMHQPRPWLELEPDWSRRGIGMSDVPPLSPLLAQRVEYTNTYIDRFPMLDVRSPPPELVGTMEFVLCCDVLEHVPDPVAPAIAGILDILRPGGFAVVGVPCHVDEYDEHYPGLVSWEAVEGPGGTEVHWTDGTGVTHVDREPDIHGGEGQTLAFRDWTPEAMMDALRAAGFEDVWQPPAFPELGVAELRRPGVFLARRPA